MNYAQILGLLRAALAFGGGAALTAAGFDGNAITDVVKGASTPQGLVTGLLPIAVAGAWSYFTHKPQATAQRAAVLDPNATVAAGLEAGGKPPVGLSRHLDR